MKNDKSEDNSASEVIPEVKTPLQGGSTDVMTDSCPSDIMGGQPNILWR